MSIELLNKDGIASAFDAVVIDFNGTLAFEGRIAVEVSERLRLVSTKLKVIVATADTFGTAMTALKPAGIEVRVIETGEDKAKLVTTLGASRTIVIGNGRNDVAMFGMAGLSIAVLGPEGLSGQLAARAALIVRSVEEGLDLLLHPVRLKASLRA
jgi:P-type E1-E2 ATPase